MSDEAPETLAEDPAPEPTPADHAMAAVDAALAPAKNLLMSESGPVHASHLLHMLTCVRQALAHAVYGAPPAAEATGQSLDMAGIQTRQSDAYRAYVEQCVADGETPVGPAEFAANASAVETGELNDADAKKAATGNEDLASEWAAMTPAARTAAWAEPNHGGLDLAGVTDPDAPGGANQTPGDKLFS